MTQMEDARKGRVTEEMKRVSEIEGVDVEKISKGVASGRIVIPSNLARDIEAVGIGEGLRVKINANIGTSMDFPEPESEIEKAKAAVECGADTIMDLSTGGDINNIRREILKIPVPLGTVPIYQAAVKVTQQSGGAIVDMTEDDLFGVIEEQARDGVDFMTLHVGLTKESLGKLQEQGRLTGIVSRGGSFLAAWIIHNEKENPLYENYDYLLEMAKEHDITLSLGDALRPGSLKDATDRAQIQELIVLSELVDRAWDAGVQCMVEGPGHMSLDQIESNIVLQKKMCKGAPFYVLGPIVTDVAPGYDHISAAIGGAIAAFSGADFLCYVTPAEHLALPDVDDVREGVIASKIAAHAVDLARGIDTERDNEMAKARVDLDWEKQFKLCLDPKKAMAYRRKRHPHNPEVCTMCGDFCAMKVVKEYLH